ncbi:unnamed protein product [Urochloa humidicola]
MESVEGMMERMNLSAAEKKGIRIGTTESSGARSSEPQAIGKVLAEKLVNADGLAQALGRIWCPIKGVSCKDLGENQFLFTFGQASGKRRALEEGPWMFGKDLLIMVELDESKTIDEMEFAFIPIWVRVMKLLLGMMNKATGEAIGEEIGTFMAMDMDEDGTVMGRYLRVKVKLDIRKPLMRGVTVFAGEEEKPLWCPLEYEFLPDFCYTCGLIGHTDKVCGVQLEKGAVQQFSKKLRCFPERRRMGDGGFDRPGGGRAAPAWRPGGSGSRNSSGFSGSKSLSGRGGSDAPSWRKDAGGFDLRKDGVKAQGEEAEVTSPLKICANQHSGEKSKKALFKDDGLVGDKEKGEDVESQGEKNGDGSTVENSAMQIVQNEAGEKQPAMGGGLLGEKSKRKGTYKKVTCSVQGGKDGEKKGSLEGRKRNLEMMEIDDAENGQGMGKEEEETEKFKRAKKAGLADQSCAPQ